MKTLAQVAELVDKMYSDASEVPSMGYEPEGDPCKGPATKLAEENGFTYDEVMHEINRQWHQETRSCEDLFGG